VASAVLVAVTVCAFFVVRWMHREPETTSTMAPPMELPRAA
jgi:hypothetical protein